jgi:hypothetical protein
MEDPSLWLNDIGASQCCNQFFNGSISNVQVYDSILTQQQVLQMYQQGLGGAPVAGTQWNLAAWYPLDGDAADYNGGVYVPDQGSQYTPTNNGTIYGGVQMAQINASAQQPSHVLAALFSGQRSAVQIPSISNSLSGNFSISAWVYSDGATSDHHCQGIFGDWPNPGDGFQLLGYGGSACSLFYVDTQSVPWPSASQSGIPSGKWMYMVATYNGRTGNASIYLNDVLFASKTLNPGLDIGQTSKPFYIGNDAWQPGVSDSFYGSIANLQLYGSVLTAGQMSQLYSSGMASLPMQNQGLLAWYPLDGNANDYSKYGNDGVPGNVVYTLQSQDAPYYTQSLSGTGASFSGSGGNIIIGNAVPLGSGITASAWIYPKSSNNAGGDRQVVVGEGSSYELSINYYHRMEGDFWIWTGSGWKVVSTPSSLNPNSWYMLAGSYNGQDVSIYVDGVLANSIAQQGSVQDPGMQTVIGSYESAPYSDYYFNGTIADVQLYSTALTTQQIGQLYDSGAPLYSSASVPMGLIT